MKLDIKTVFSMILISVLVMGTLPIPRVTAQDEGVPFDFETLLSEGAEVLFTNIDPDGAPSIVYGQLGLPSEDLDLSNTMYNDMLALAMVSTRGEFLEYIFELLGVTLFAGNDSGGGDGGFFPAQFDGGEFNFEQILSLIGTDFSLLFSAYLNIDQATAATRMGQVLSHLGTTFQFSFAEMLALRIDETMLPPEAELPFSSIDLFIYQVTNEFASTLQLVVGGLSSEGIYGAVDTDLFLDTRGAAAGILAIPDLAFIADVFGGFDSNSSYSPISPGFITSQFPENLDGPLSIAAVGYIDEQVLSSEDTELSIGGLIGATSAITPLTTHSYVVSLLPPEVNITGISPSTEGLAHYDNQSNFVFWNASGLGTQSDYLVYFDEDEFPPEVTIERTFDPDALAVGGTTTVTVVVTNNGDTPVTDVTISDTNLESMYPGVTVTGATTLNIASVPASGTAQIEYDVTFHNEGGYTFPKAELNYTYDSRMYSKDTTVDGVTVANDIGGVAAQILGDAYANFPIPTLAIGGLMVIGLIINIVGFRKGGGGEGYQV